CFLEIAARWPRSTEAHVGLARLARNVGDSARTSEHLATALAIDPDCIDALTAVVELEQGKLNPELRRHVCCLAEDEHRPLRHRSHLHFALAQNEHRARAYDDAFRSYQRANDLRRIALERAGRFFDPAAHATYVDGQIRVFTADYFRLSTG